MSFRRPGDPEALERWKQAQHALKEQRRAARASDPRLQAMKKAAKEKQRAAYEKAKERNRAALAEARKRQRAAYEKAKERRKELLVAAQKKRHEREAAKRAERDAALIRKFVRPATTSGNGATASTPGQLAFIKLHTRGE
jgi:hypothetical protein